MEGKTTPCLHAAAAERNKGPILGVLTRVLPATGLVLEVASGTGQHVVHFGWALASLEWQPTDIDPASIASIAAWREAEKLTNVRAPLLLDVCSERWPLARADAIVCCNLIHIAPWQAAEGLMRGAARVLRRGGVLFLYGPYRRHGAHTAPSNEAFDAQLRSQDPEWGVRDMEAVAMLATENGFAVAEVVPMPANNFSLVFRRL